MMSETLPKAYKFQAASYPESDARLIRKLIKSGGEVYLDVPIEPDAHSGAWVILANLALPGTLLLLRTLKGRRRRKKLYNWDSPSWRPFKKDMQKLVKKYRHCFQVCPGYVIEICINKVPQPLHRHVTFLWDRKKLPQWKPIDSKEFDKLLQDYCNRILNG